MVEVTKDYAFDGPEGTIGLLDLFDGRRQLLVYHFMFDPEWEADDGCKSCSFTIDNVGHLSHLHARDTSLALVSRAPHAKLEHYKQRMGWVVPWYSSHGSDFNYDFHVTLDPSVAPVQYNFKDQAQLEREDPTGRTGRASNRAPARFSATGSACSTRTPPTPAASTRSSGPTTGSI